MLLAKKTERNFRLVKRKSIRNVVDFAFSVYTVRLFVIFFRSNEMFN